MERDQRTHAPDLELPQCANHAAGGAVAVHVPDDELGDHRVVQRRDLEAGLNARVHAHARAGRLAVGGDRAGRGREVLGSVLRVHPALDRVPAEADVLLRHRQLLPGRDPELLADDVDPGGHLGHAVLHLHARVHLEEEVLAVREEPLHGARGPVAHRPRGLGADLADALAHLAVDRRRRALLDELLVTALDRAIALAKMDHVALRVGEHLDLHVAWVRQVALDVDGRIREELLALARGALEGLLQLVGRHRHPEALAPTAAGRLDGNRVADRLIHDPGCVLDGVYRVGRAGHDRHTGLLHQLARAGLGTHRVDRVGGRADEDEAGVLDGAREARVLGQEAVPGVDRLGARLLRRLDDLLDHQVALVGRAGAD